MSRHKPGPAVSAAARQPNPKYPFDTREFVNDVIQIQSSVKDVSAARDLVVLVIHMVKESLSNPRIKDWDEFNERVKYRRRRSVPASGIKKGG